ncbi:hypothetical protein HDU99_001530, partial [Rhizoclosmatium hyalinum]
AVEGNLLTGTVPPVLAAKKGLNVKFGLNCLNSQPNQRAYCYRKAPDCRAISLDSGYQDPKWKPLWDALANVDNDMNAFDKAVDQMGYAYFGVREYEFQAFRHYAQQRTWCMKKHPEFVFLG